MKKILTLILVATMFVLAGCNSASNNLTADQFVEQAKEHVKMMSPEDLYKLMESDEFYTLVDVRTAVEHYYGYIPGSVLINRGSLEFKILKDKFWEESGDRKSVV